MREAWSRKHDPKHSTCTTCGTHVNVTLTTSYQVSPGYLKRQVIKDTIRPKTHKLVLTREKKLNYTVLNPFCLLKLRISLQSGCCHRKRLQLG